MNSAPIHVIKLGGSLLELPQLLDRFSAICAADASVRRLVVVGGGRAADAVRLFDRRFGLDPQQGHWLAIRAMSFNAHLFAAVMDHVEPACTIKTCERIWSSDKTAVMEPLSWLEDEHRRGIVVPHVWEFTSDSIAAHVATRLGAGRLTLLKSALPKGECAIADVARRGLVDREFPTAAKGIEHVEIINLRNDPPVRRRLR